MKKANDNTDTTNGIVVENNYATSNEEIKRILKESRKAMEEYYEKENSKKETKQKNKRFSTKTKIKR